MCSYVSQSFFEKNEKIKRQDHFKLKGGRYRGMDSDNDVTQANFAEKARKG